MLVDTSSAHNHSQCHTSMEWPPYQGPPQGPATATLGRRQGNGGLPTNIPPPPAQLPPPNHSSNNLGGGGVTASSIVGVGPRGGLTGFRGPSSGTSSTSSNGSQ